MIRQVNLFDVCKPKQWKTIASSQLHSEGYPVYGANGKIGFYSEYTHENPTLLITCRGATCGVLNICEPKSYVNGNAMALDNLSLDVSLRYLFHYLNHRGFDDVISGSAQPQITRQGLQNIKVPLPPFVEQQKIARILDAADDLRQKDQQLVDHYTALGQALFIEMFGDPVTNPMGWEIAKLGDIGNISSGSTPSREISEYYNGEIPWVKTGEVCGEIILKTSEHISKMALQNSSCKLYPSGSLIIAMYGQGKTRGQVAMLGIPAATNQACAVIQPSSKMSYDFLFDLLKLLYDDLRDLGRGGSQPNLNGGLLKSYEVISPPLSLQNQFAERITLIEAQKKQAQASLALSQSLFDSLLHRAFTGALTA